MQAGEYLVNHGRAAFLGRFLNRAGTEFEHGDRVVLRTSRGLEAGTVLSEAKPAFAHLVGSALSGELLRPLSPEDRCSESAQRLRAERLLAEAQTLADSLLLPMTVLDAEILLDGELAILQALPFEECDAATFCDELSRRHSLLCQLHDLRQAPALPEPEKAGCGKPGCGSSGGGGGCSSCGTGGGCSTGSCSSGKVKNAEELTSYFSGLRQQMESQGRRVSLRD